MIVDRLLEEKVGFGKAQTIPLIFLSLIDLNDGAQLILSTLLFLNHRLIPHSYRADGVETRTVPNLSSDFYFLLSHFLWIHHEWKVG